MAYGSIYPATYQPMYYQQPTMQAPQQPAQPVQQQNQSSIVWVQGEAGAKSYLLAPNTTIPLWDSESQTIYLKSTDGSGMPTIKYIDYTIRESNAAPSNNVVAEKEKMDFATKDDIADLATEIADLKRRVNDISHRPTRRRETTSNE